MPTVRTVEDINNKFESVGMFFRDYESEYQAKRLGDFNLFMNEDLEDCIRPLSTAEIDPSIINLRNDPHKHVIFSKNRKDDVLCSLDKQEDQKLRLDLYRFFEENGGQGWFKKVLSGDQIKSLKNHAEKDAEKKKQRKPKKKPSTGSLSNDIVDLTQDQNEVIDVEDKPILGQVPPLVDEEWGDYNGMDISSLCRDNGIRSYFK